MPKNEDHLSNEVSVAVVIEEKGIKGAAKSRAVAAFDRLVGAAFDVPAAWLEGKAEAVRKNASQALVIDHGPEPASADQGPVVLTNEQRVLVAVEKQDLRKLENKKAVVEETLHDLASSEEPAKENADEIDLDWLNFFEGYAEKASSEKVRSLWARILAGEIRRPGRFSLRTLRFLSEIDTATAQLFEKYATVRLQSDFIFREEDLSDQRLLELIELEEAGLLQEANGHLQQNLGVQNNVAHWVGEHSVLILKTKNEGGKIAVPLAKISRIGAELCALLPKQDDQVFFIKVADYLFSKEEITEAQIAVLISRDGNKIRYNIIRTLHAPNSEGT